MSCLQEAYKLTRQDLLMECKWNQGNRSKSDTCGCQQAGWAASSAGKWGWAGAAHDQPHSMPKEAEVTNVTPLGVSAWSVQPCQGSTIDWSLPDWVTSTLASSLSLLSGSRYSTVAKMKHQQKRPSNLATGWGVGTVSWRQNVEDNASHSFLLLNLTNALRLRPLLLVTQPFCAIVHVCVHTCVYVHVFMSPCCVYSWIHVCYMCVHTHIVLLCLCVWHGTCMCGMCT